MNEARLVKVSKYLSKHLRHDPAGLGLTLAPGGWVRVDALLAARAAHRFSVSRVELDEVVARTTSSGFRLIPLALLSGPIKAIAWRWTCNSRPLRRLPFCITAQVIKLPLSLSAKACRKCAVTTSICPAMLTRRVSSVLGMADRSSSR